MQANKVLLSTFFTSKTQESSDSGKGATNMANAKLGRPRKYEGTETRVTIRLSEDQRKKVRHYAAIDDTSMTEIVNTALTHYINRRDGYLKMGKRMSK